MNNLEEHIRNQREEFDDLLPPEGHFERFNDKLNKKMSAKSYVMRIAAIFIVGIIITGVSFYSIRNLNMNNNIYASADKDLQEAVYYYASINNEMEDKIKEMDIEDAEKEQILKDIDTYDQGFEEIKEDLKDYPEDERVKNAVISHHRGKTAMLNIIISR